ISGTRVKVIEVALDKLAHGSSPEEMAFQYPHLSLAQIHAALAYYYEHQRELDADIHRRWLEVKALAAQETDSPLQRRVRKMGGDLYMDVHVRRAGSAGLGLRSVDVLTAQEDGIGELPDPELLDRATELGRVLFTQDDDLLREAKRRQQTGESFAGLIYVHQL